MKKFYSIGETARLAEMTIETLRHYDRIGLLKPAKVDKQSGYRYYTDEELIYLEVIGFYRKNSMSLNEIKDIFQKDFTQITAFLEETENRIEAEISRLHKIKFQISNLHKQLTSNTMSLFDDFHVKTLPLRVIVLADSLQEATLDNFRKLHDELYGKLGKEARKYFQLDDSAHFFVSQLTDSNKMFSVCTKFIDHPKLHYLHERNYLCFTCTVEEKEHAIEKGLAMTKENYGGEPDFILIKVIFTGMFHWKYEIQIPLP
ncbi:hypothetical protein NCCP2222_36220 [Sporosarcina sp. NCCP-2222]|uniref:MerR family transcriptional regulator n=1 Tax=Sporosarcina sp. NCCP-2222 TaxID=2935073 RepID=UPI002081C2AF|nr:MerR family transcriptional regulator [Sporosarcina sp. NCCP-2222]GKV57675.1 hypothetical protein NCCP2222_36220 [Sporosarcina sp. NCCP-2222]